MKAARMLLVVGLLCFGVLSGFAQTAPDTETLVLSDIVALAQASAQAAAAASAEAQAIATDAQGLLGQLNLEALISMAEAASSAAQDAAAAVASAEASAMAAASAYVQSCAGAMASAQALSLIHI